MSLDNLDQRINARIDKASFADEIKDEEGPTLSEVPFARLLRVLGAVSILLGLASLIAVFIEQTVNFFAYFWGGLTIGFLLFATATMLEFLYKLLITTTRTARKDK